MCGFVGYINNHADVADDTIVNMANRIRHRGPDDAAYYRDDEVAIGFRRLAMVDIACGAQPMYNADKSVILTFNGEIYNFMDIRKELEGLGYEFKTDVDSEVLLHGYEAWGVELLQKLRGMFAFAIYDKNKEQLFLARDHFGIKPLYYYDDGKTFLWASEIKAFLDHPKFVKELNTELLPIHLSFEFIPSRETMFKHVYKVMPGQYLIYKDGQVDIQTYYKFNYDNIDESQNIEEDSEKIREIVRDSVKAHMFADVEVGSFLSSGVDSSYVFNEASKIKKDNIQSFTLGYDHSKYSEIDWARDFASDIGQKNTPIKMDSEDYFGILPTIMYYMDEPLSNPSEVNLYFLSKGTRQHVKGTLSGEGADEFFGGYNTYLEARPFERYQKFVPSAVRKGLAKAVANMPRFHGKRFLTRGAQSLDERYYRVNYVFNYDERQKILKDKNLNVDSGAYTKHIFDEVADKDEMTQMQYFDINTWLPFDILQKADRMSMANSLEVRTPLVDKEIAKFAATMPIKTRIQGDTTKVSFRKAAQAELPEKVAQKEKMGFPSPLAQWMREPKYRKMIENAFTSDVAKKFFDTDALLAYLKEHVDGKSNMQKILTIYTFILWYEIYFPEDCENDIRDQIQYNEVAAHANE